MLLKQTSHSNFVWQESGSWSPRQIRDGNQNTISGDNVRFASKVYSWSKLKPWCRYILSDTLERFGRLSGCRQLIPRMQHFNSLHCWREQTEVLCPVVGSQKPQGIIRVHSNKVPGEPKMLIYFLLHWRCSPCFKSSANKPQKTRGYKKKLCWEMRVCAAFSAR